MYGEKPENIFYYLTVYNEPILQPAEPAELDVDGLLKGLYRYAPAPAVDGAARGRRSSPPAPACSGRSRRSSCWPRTGAWPPTSGRRPRGPSCAATRSQCEEHNLLHPGERAAGAVRARGSWPDGQGPVVAVSDFMRAVPDLISRWVPGDYTSLGTDGFGMSDTRHALRRHFHVDAESIAVATLRQLALRGEVPTHVPAEAAKKYAIDDVTRRPGRRDRRRQLIRPTAVPGPARWIRAGPAAFTPGSADGGEAGQAFQ